MKFRINVVLSALAMMLLVACSDSDNKADNKQANATAPQTTNPSAPPAHQLSPQQQAAVNDAKGLPKQGTVTEMMHAAGYTYMHVDTGDGKPMWIAATMMRVKPQDKVQWADAAVMRNFASKSLHRTFDEILFVSNASVIQ